MDVPLVSDGERGGTALSAFASLLYTRMAPMPPVFRQRSVQDSMKSAASDILQSGPLAWKGIELQVDNLKADRGPATYVKELGYSKAGSTGPVYRRCHDFMHAKSESERISAANVPGAPATFASMIDAWWISNRFLSMLTFGIARHGPCKEMATARNAGRPVE